jgi:hypothetical protein
MLLILHLPLFEPALLDSNDIGPLNGAPRDFFVFCDAELRCSSKQHLLECRALTAPILEFQSLAVWYQCPFGMTIVGWGLRC